MDLRLTFTSSARHENDNHDQLVSGAPTPSGVQTPQPDLSDKRLPGIMHSYFGQVGRNPSSKFAPRNTCAAPLDSSHVAPLSHMHKRQKTSRSSSGSSESMVVVEHEKLQERTPPLQPGEQESTKLDSKSSPRSVLPPTPVSSGSSIVQKEPESAENGKPLIEQNMNSVTQTLRDFVLSKTPIASQARRHQSLPIASLSLDPVAAAHIASPSKVPECITPSKGGTSTSVSMSKLPISRSSREASKLTSSATIKSTPPQTPRTMSQERHPSDKRSPLSSTSTASKAEEPKDCEKPNSGTISKAGLPSGRPKGKLDVKIQRARGLKQCYDPYVVCVFEWNEFVSKGPKNDAMHMDVDESGEGPEKKSRAQALSSRPIRRIDSDMGKPMAIPMKSRQSSNNPEMDTNGDPKTDPITDPHWDHEATL